MSTTTATKTKTVNVPKTNIRQAIKNMIARVKNAMPYAEVSPEDLEHQAKVAAIKVQAQIAAMNIR